MTGISPPFAKLTDLVTCRVLPGRVTPHALVAKVVGTPGGGRGGGPDADPHDRCAGAGDGRTPAPRSGGGGRAGGDGSHRGRRVRGHVDPGPVRWRRGRPGTRRL